MGLNAIVLNVWGNIKMTAFDKALPKVQEATGRYDPPKENTLIATLAGKKPKKEDSTFDKAWGVVKGKTIRSKQAARNNKERQEVRAMRKPRQSTDPKLLARLMRELGIGYSGSEFNPKED
jgi:hypothetical protein